MQANCKIITCILWKDMITNQNFYMHTNSWILQKMVKTPLKTNDRCKEGYCHTLKQFSRASLRIHMSSYCKLSNSKNRRSHWRTCVYGTRVWSKISAHVCCTVQEWVANQYVVCWYVCVCVSLWFIAISLSFIHDCKKYQPWQQQQTV